jgi:hypothetical protein
MQYDRVALCIVALLAAFVAGANGAAWLIGRFEETSCGPVVIDFCDNTYRCYSVECSDEGCEPRRVP